ncbi:SIR2 family protein [Tepidibacillus marianensis]|uniref:SIR2 family protein n=1 Tax=Tepidibacillus marianensis TaxID=3131995 RepID=UPI0030D3DD72
MDILDKLIQKNEFPVVFIGAGISKRFLNNFPDWTSLLEEFWKQAGLTNFYGELNNLRDQIKNDNGNYTEKEIEHFSNIRIGSILEDHFNRSFNNETIEINGFTTKNAYETKISPFKKAISERFKYYSLKEGVDKELSAFKKMLMKTQIILTTNYDEFIERSYDENSSYKIKKYIGQKGFFQETYGIAELYKLHGCVTSPSDIVITEKDYEKFDKNSVLISAKIISMMMYSPIIFMGYSLTDINVRNIIKEFTRSLTDHEIQILEERLILIEREEGRRNFIEEVINDKDLGCKLKVIKTDNFQLLFEKISSINQGIAPTEVRKYQHVIKKLIIDRGKKGTLNSVLLSPEELDSLEANLQTKNITVALGDAKYIFQIPDIITYALDYISDKDEISTDIRMRFAVNQNGNARFPINKLLNEHLINSSSLHASEKEKLLGKIEKFSNFDLHYNSINLSSVITRKLLGIEEINKLDNKKTKVYETLSYHIKEFNLDHLRDYLIKELEDLKEKGEIKISTELRRLLLLYDILKYKRSNA